jgi:hypothetical protein
MFVSGGSPVVGFCEHGNKLLLHKSKIFLVQTSN